MEKISMAHKILIVDDDMTTCDDLTTAVKRFGFDTISAYSGLQAINIVERDESVKFVVTDVHMPEMNGIELVKTLKKSFPLLVIVMMSGVDDIIDSINAIELGAVDFLPKPIQIKQLVSLLDQFESQSTVLSVDHELNSYVHKQMSAGNSVDVGIYMDFPQNNMCKPLGSMGIFSESMLGIYNKLRKLHAYPEIPILIEGKTGTGKEVIAKFIHYDGQSKNEPFVAVNCATFSKEMFEAELFGYEKGAFTGASPKGHEGLLSKAGKGTIFLDEFTEIEPDVQAKLLRLLQEGEYYKVGGTHPIRNNARIVCSTNEHAESLTKDGRLREDLFYRLNVCKVYLPELNNRKEEILPMTLMFLHLFKRKFKKNINEITAAALNRIYTHLWPGNVRELENTLMKSILFSEKNVLDVDDILFDDHIMAPLSIDKTHNVSDPRFSIPFMLPDESFDLNAFILEIVGATVEKFDQNKTKAADYLGLTRSQMYNKYKVD